jgi:hypothetical protein
VIRIAVTVVRPRPKGKHGDPAPNTAETRFQLDGVQFAPGGTRELNYHQNTVTFDAQIYTPRDIPQVLPKDRIEVPDQGVFQVEGEVQVWGNFGCVINLSKVTG